MEATKLLPVAALGVMVYAPTGASAADPAGLPLAARVTPVTVSPFCSPIVENAVVPRARSAPYVLLCALAVTVNGAGFTVSVKEFVTESTGLPSSAATICTVNAPACVGVPDTVRVADEKDAPDGKPNAV